MRRVILMAVLALALPVAAFANSIDIGNVGGTLSQNASGGLSLTSTVWKFGSQVNASGLGTLTFSINGPLVSGDLQNGGTFATGGTFTISINGGPTYTGTFSGSAPTWEMKTLANGNHYYIFSGSVSGPGFSGGTVQITMDTGKGFFGGSVEVGSGDTLVTVPEPGTLGMLGTGLVGVAGLIRRKIKLG